MRGGMKAYRRHSQTCPHLHKKREYDRCNCPLWTDGVLNGERYHRTLHTRDWKQAARIVAELEGGALLPVKPIHEAIKSWEAAQKDRFLKPETTRKCKRLMAQLLSWCKENGCREMGKLGLQELQEFRRSRAHLKARTNIVELQTLRTFFGFCEAMNWIRGNPTKLISAPKVPTSEVVPFTPMEMTAIMWACNEVKTDYAQKRTLAMVLLMRHTGLRVGDVLMLRRDRIKDGRIMLYTQKNSRPVTMALPVDVLAALASLPEPLGGGLECPVLFLQWQEYTEEHGVSGPPHLA